MDSDFASKLQSVLSNPEAMAKITSIASSMGNDTAPAAEPVSQPPLSTESAPAIKPALQNFMPQGDPRLSLLASLKPLLREDKQSRVDSLINALTVASVIKTFRK